MNSLLSRFSECKIFKHLSEVNFSPSLGECALLKARLGRGGDLVLQNRDKCRGSNWVYGQFRHQLCLGLSLKFRICRVERWKRWCLPRAAGSGFWGSTWAWGAQPTDQPSGRKGQSVRSGAGFAPPRLHSRRGSAQASNDPRTLGGRNPWALRAPRTPPIVLATGD